MPRRGGAAWDIQTAKAFFQLKVINQLIFLPWQGMRVIAEQLGPDCVLFPSLYEQPLVDQWLHETYRITEEPAVESLAQASFPNRFLALVPAAQAKALGEAARQAVMAEWRRLTQAVKSHIEGRVPEYGLSTDDIWNQLWQSHRDACFETYWIAWPWGNDPHAIMQEYKHWLAITDETSFERVIDKFKQRRASYVNPGTLYPWLYDLTERALGSRKALRAYSAVPEGGFKCVLCGVREALRPERAQGYREVGVFWANISQAFRSDFQAAGRERLCAVCVTKRLAVDAYLRPRLDTPNVAFPSTSTMAVESFRAEAFQKSDGLQVELQGLVDAFREVRLQFNSSRARPVPGVQRLAQQKDLAPLVQMDGRWFYRESYEPNALMAEFGEDAVAAEGAMNSATHARDKLQGLLKASAALSIAAPSTYYAIVYMDGDRMGEWLSGEHEEVPTIAKVLHPRVREALQHEWQDILGERRPLAPSLHTAVSTALRAFSQEVVRPIVEAHYGMLVYAGGDDVIAFFPLRHVLAAVWVLRRLYSGMAYECHGFQSRRGFVRRDGMLWMMMGQAATASAGIAIAHHLQPLSQALDAAREAVHVAKHALGRDAFAVNLLKRSGERLLTGAKFMYDADTPSIELIQRVMNALRPREDATLSSRLMYQLAQESPLGLLESNAVAAQEAELKRLIRRHVESSNGDDTARAQMIQQVTTDLTQLLRAMRTTHQDLGNTGDMRMQTPFQVFTSLLLLARFIAMEGDV